ncbi:T9SS type A sorting domain-containing protein [uncultured Psychroserpens sp.]|uniref:T9SS type A sorting domain-containing protein n=1 Tax=uncultured Psychroserpens sp. TaxID=255436 RepID=UPI0026160551|nr:T9SS type A sorting domain-containing protein [uncultured Psychroserpens sp.]
MKYLCFTIFLLVSFFSFGQCPTSGITLSSQVEVDDFTTNYPGCTDLDYRLTISGNDIIDLSPLSTLNSVKGLTVRDNLELVSLNGLNLSEIGYEITQLSIENNNALFDISALSSATFEINTFDNSSGEVRIKNNPFLSDLIGLEGLPEYVYSIYIQNNNFLDDLTGLSTVKITEDLVIEDNSGLTSFDGFSLTHQTGTFVFVNNNAMVSMNWPGNITPICGLEITDNILLEDIDAGFIYPGNDVCSTYIDISNNPNLIACSSDYLCSVLALISDATISNNAIGCNSPEEVETQCPECPTEPLILSSQALVNDFQTIYPNCTELDFDLLISGDDITDLNPLSNLSSVRSLHIIDNLQLTSLQGLNLSVVNANQPQLIIQNNPLLTNISVLSTTTFDFFPEGNTGSVSIINNPLLSSLNGLQGLSGFVFQVLIDNNDSLLNLEGLNNIAQVDDLYIENNGSLFNLNGLDNLNLAGGIGINNNSSLVSLGGINGYSDSIFTFELNNNVLLNDISALNDAMFIDNFAMNNNSNLSVCNITSVCNLINAWNLNPSSFEIVLISNNAVGCENIPQVVSACGITLSIDDSFESSLSLYPNPVNNLLEFESSRNVNTLEVYNLLGQNVLRSFPNNPSGQLDLSSLNSGMYIVKIEMLHSNETFRIIKE